MMKPILLLALTMVYPLASFAETRKPSSAKSCASTALKMAEDEYGNDPKECHVTHKNAGVYVVTVGIGNAEDGAHTYKVTFEDPKACDIQTATVVEVQSKK